MVEYNQSFFETESNLSAYFAGFIFADGCIYDGKNYLSIEITEKDKSVLEKLCEAVGADKKRIKHRPPKGGTIRGKSFPGRNSFVKLNLSGKKFVDDLRKFGVIANKTYNYQEPFFDESFLLPFLIGMIDGDGCIESPRQIRLYSNQKMLEWLKNKLEEKDIFCGRIGPTRGKCSRFAISRRASIGKIKAFIDQNISCAVLERKWSKLEAPR